MREVELIERVQSSVFGAEGIDSQRGRRPSPSPDKGSRTLFARTRIEEPRFSLVHVSSLPCMNGYEECRGLCWNWKETLKAGGALLIIPKIKGTNVERAIDGSGERD